MVCDQSWGEVSPVVCGGFVTSRGRKCLLWFMTSRGEVSPVVYDKLGREVYPVVYGGSVTSHGGKCLLWFMVGL